jgi:hypothetical protein
MAEKSGVQASFTLKKDVADALRQEVSVITKEHDTKLYRPVVTQTVDFMKSQYGKFIQPKKKRQVAGLEDRLFVVDTHDFKTLYEEWSKNYDENGDQVEGDKLQIEPGIRAFRGGQGGLMVFEDLSPKWEGLTPDVKELVRQFAQDETGAKQLFGATVMTSDIAHETIHNLHQDGLPESFFELGVRHYTNEYMKFMALDEFDLLLNGENKTVPSRAYLYLTDKFGENVPKWFFGQEVDQAIKYDMWQTAELLTQYFKLPFKRYLVKDDSSGPERI